jgi:hypothetical protein
VDRGIGVRRTRLDHVDAMARLEQASDDNASSRSRTDDDEIRSFTYTKHDEIPSTCVPLRDQTAEGFREICSWTKDIWRIANWCHRRRVFSGGDDDTSGTAFTTGTVDGAYFHRLRRSDLKNAQAVESDLAVRLWERSAELTGLSAGSRT